MRDSKIILFNEEARRKLQTGVNKISDAVRVTLGAKGKNVLIEGYDSDPQVTNDGVSIAKVINFEDRVENLGAQVIKQVATNTNNDAGDGTTTATILAQAIINEGLRNVAAGTNPREINRGIEACVKICVEDLKEMSEEVFNQIENIATISADNEEMGEIIAELISKVGVDGAITVENNQFFGLTKELVKGSQLEAGYLSPFMITDKSRQEAILEKPLIFITDFKITTQADMLAIMQAAMAANKKELVVIAEDIDGDALATAVINRARGAFNLLAVKAPNFGEGRDQILDDLANLVGAKFVSKDKGDKLDALTTDMFGTAEKVIADKNQTTIISGDSNKQEIKARIKTVKKFLKDGKEKRNPTDIQRFRDRLARLTAQVGIIKVGAASDIEVTQKKQKIEDALNATRAAIESGIIPGGGVALLRVKENMRTTMLGDASIGMKILLNALSAPFEQLCENAGIGSDVLMKEIAENKNPYYGYDFKEMEYTDLKTAGVVDPVKVVISALQNAASAAGMLLTTEAVVVDANENDTATE